MAPRKRADFVLVHLKFYAFLTPEIQRFTNVVREFSEPISVDPVGMWFYIVTEAEKKKLPGNIDIKFNDWQIKSTNALIFIKDHLRYDNIMIFVGDDTLYWIYYTNAPEPKRVVGSTSLPQSFCGCCINIEYKKLLAVVKNYSLSQPYIVFGNLNIR